MDSCSGVQRNISAIGAPAISLLGGLTAFIRTHHVWRGPRRLVDMAGAAWFLLVLMLVF